MADAAITVDVMKMKDAIETTLCCGRPMEVKMDMGRVWEVVCRTCGDVVYIKKEIPKPSLLDD